jgi:hypothetical protein
MEVKEEKALFQRALIPGHLLNANHWFNKHHCWHSDKKRTEARMLEKKGCCTVS